MFNIATKNVETMMRTFVMLVYFMYLRFCHTKLFLILNFILSSILFLNLRKWCTFKMISDMMEALLSAKNDVSRKKYFIFTKFYVLHLTLLLFRTIILTVFFKLVREGFLLDRTTTMPKKSEMHRVRYIIDAAGLPMGRLSAQVASILRGKIKPLFAPHVDCGDYVAVVNCDKIVLTGKKLSNKRRYRYTGYIGHLKTIKYSDLMSSDPCKAIRWAVKGMLPSNTLGRAQIKRLSLFCGDSVKDSEKMQVWNSFRKVKVS